MLVKNIDSARLQGKNMPGGKLDHFPFTAKAIVSFYMVFVLKFKLGAFKYGRIVNRETNHVVRDDQTLAVPSLTTHMPRSVRY